MFKNFSLESKQLTKIFLSIFCLSIFAVFFSFKILEVPRGLTVDEAAFGYNASLLSRTGYDENGRFLPFFVLSIEGKDWRQPVPQYYITAFFKMFGASVFNLRFSSVVITLLSTVLIYFLARKLVGDILAIITSIVFITTPLIMIQSHLALDNIMPIPWVILWLIFIYYFEKKKSLKYLIFAGMSLGISFYTYKGMRAIVPTLSLLTLCYITLLLVSKRSDIISSKYIKSVIAFTCGIAPFILIIPVLSKYYAGALFGGTRPEFSSWQEFFNPYISSFDLSFLYITGDALLYHSTGKHGMLLLATLPFFIFGAVRSTKREKFWWLILAAFILTPLLYGLIGSVHRASRLMTLIPFYSLITALGFFELYLLSKKNSLLKILIVFSVILASLNYYDFIKYYWFTYEKASDQYFGKMEVHESYKTFSEEAQKLNLTPYISKNLLKADGESGKFYVSLYFPEGIKSIDDEQETPSSGSVLMTTKENIETMTKSQRELKFYRLYIN